MIPSYKLRDGGQWLQWGRPGKAQCPLFILRRCMAVSQSSPFSHVTWDPEHLARSHGNDQLRERWMQMRHGDILFCQVPEEG